LTVDSTEVVCPENLFFEKIAKIQRSYVPLCEYVTFVLLTPALTIIDKKSQ